MACCMRSLTNISPRPQGTITLVVPKQTVTFIVSQRRLQYNGRGDGNATRRSEGDAQSLSTALLGRGPGRKLTTIHRTKSTADAMTCRPVIRRQRRCLRRYVPRSFGYWHGFSADDDPTVFEGGRYGIIARKRTAAFEHHQRRTGQKRHWSPPLP